MADEDRRAIIAEALEASEAANASPTPTPAPSAVPPEPQATPAPREPIETPQGTPAPTSAPSGTPEPTPAPVADADKAPQSWRPAEKVKWASLDPDIRKEVLRREREITTTLNETAQARQLANTFQAAVQPYMARIQSMGANPVQAVESLLRADHLLSTSNKSQRAQLMAKLISDYDVDIMALDSALAGKPQADPVESRVEQLLQQRLAPFQQYLTHQQMMEQQRQQQVQANSASEVERMSQDPKYPHFNAVRADMADILAIQSNKGVYLSLEDAYNRAIAMNPEVAKAVAAQNSTQQQRENVAKANAQAQRALNASKSVGGAPAGGHTGSVNGNDRRATIAAAFDELASR